MEVLLALHALATIMLAGLIWFVQIVYYPLLSIVGPQSFVRYEEQHVRRTSWIVGPVMILELLSATLLTVSSAPGAARWLSCLGLIVLGAIWCSTAFVQVPCHRKLSQGFVQKQVDRLTSSNWLRTWAWTLRTLIAVTVFSRVLVDR